MVTLLKIDDSWCPTQGIVHTSWYLSTRHVAPTALAGPQPQQILLTVVWESVAGLSVFQIKKRRQSEYREKEGRIERDVSRYQKSKMCEPRGKIEMG